jgi:hypothetical protein
MTDSDEAQIIATVYAHSYAAVTRVLPNISLEQAQIYARSATRDALNIYREMRKSRNEVMS